MIRALGFVLLVFLFSCKTHSVALKTPIAPSPKVDTVAAIVNSLVSHEFRFEWFTAKAKIEVIEGDNKTDFTANFRIRNDSAIWISISPALGVEVARMLLTRDSIHVIDRFDKKHYGRDYIFFKPYTSLPIDLSTIQNLISGNPLFLQNNYDTRITDSLITLVSTGQDHFDSLVVTRDFLPLNQFISDSAGSLFTSNEEYDIQYTPPFSLLRRITLLHPKRMEIRITFSRIKLNEPVDLPFKVD